MCPRCSRPGGGDIKEFNLDELFSIASNKLRIKPAERRQELIYLAWNIEAFPRQKRLPSLVYKFFTIS
jgi:hypothetical protein